MAHAHYYFAYGANMDEAQMRRRCRAATPIAAGRLRGYQFIINRQGWATVVSNARSEVHGVVWTITQSDELALDRYEDVKEGVYAKRQVDATLGSGAKVRALAYIAAERVPGRPRGGDLPRIIAAAKRWNLPEVYVAELRKWLKTHA